MLYYIIGTIGSFVAAYGCYARGLCVRVDFETQINPVTGKFYPDNAEVARQESKKYFVWAGFFVLVTLILIVILIIKVITTNCG